MRRIAALVVVLVGCSQLFGIHPIGDDAPAPGDGRAHDGANIGPHGDARGDAGADAAPRDRNGDSVLCGSAGPCLIGSAAPMCCELISSNNQVSFSCTASGGTSCTASPPDTTVQITCDDNTDCPSGENCCASVDASATVLVSASCSNRPCTRVLCDPNVGCGSPNATCMSMQGVTHAPPGYYWCVVPG